MSEKDRARLSEIITRIVVEALSSGEPTSRELADRIIEENEGLIQEMGFTLAARQVREMVASRMKKVAEINTHDGEQLELPLGIKGVPPALSFEVDGEDEPRYVALSRAKEWHMIAYEDLLSRQITADQGRFRAVKTLHSTLKPIFDEHPGVTVKDACRLYGQSQEDAA